MIPEQASLYPRGQKTHFPTDGKLNQLTQITWAKK